MQAGAGMIFCNIIRGSFSGLDGCSDHTNGRDSCDVPMEGMRERVRNGDFFDSGVMDQLRHQLWELTEKAHLDLGGSSHHLTFHSSVMAHRTDEAGKTSVLLRWTPEDILDDVWVPASQVDSLRQRVIPFSQLPPSTATSLHPSLYRRLRFRKHRRK
nr:hypothetical protein BaRGS_004752 [Batillaria attramentaria]